MLFAFIKNAIVKPGKLRKELVIQFDGEAGADSGALRHEFFEDIIYQGNLRLFEGENDRRIVKKDWGLEVICEIFGMMVAHSIMQEGPGFPCLSPCMFQYLATEMSDECFPVKEDIPLNIATHDLLTFIEEVSNYCQGINHYFISIIESFHAILKNRVDNVQYTVCTIC